MTTPTTSSKPEPAPLPANAYCPACGQVLPPLQVQEFPKAMYKMAPKPKPNAAAPDEEEQLETIVVLNDEEEKKKAGEGYSKEPPKPKGAADSARKHAEPPHEHKPEPPHEHNKK